MGRRRATPSATSRARSARCRSNCSGIALKDALRASIEVGDFASAVNRLNDFKTIGVSPEVEPAVVGADRTAGRRRRPHPGRARGLPLRGGVRATGRRRRRGGFARSRCAIRIGEIKKADIIAELESLTTAWRGDETEVEALQTLARLYTEEDRYRDAFHVMRVALTAYPTSPLTRNIQDEAAKTFDSLFLAGKGDALPAIDALSLFYDFRELTPIGRRGDEMIRTPRRAAGVGRSARPGAPSSCNTRSTTACRARRARRSRRGLR